MLKTALEKFQHVKIAGSSLGGAVATISLYNILHKQSHDDYDEYEKTKSRIDWLFNHDSFTTTTKVAFPSLGMIGNLVITIIGAHLDAETAMKKLIENYRIYVKVYCTLKDPVIPKEARMLNCVNCLNGEMDIITSDYYGHASFHPNAKEYLTICLKNKKTGLGYLHHRKRYVVSETEMGISEAKW